MRWVKMLLGSTERVLTSLLAVAIMVLIALIAIQ